MVNAGSTSLKLHLVHGDESRPGFVTANAVGHRVVRGGRRFDGPTLIDRIVERVRFLGDFHVKVVASREELVIAAETRRLLES